MRFRDEGFAVCRNPICLGRAIALRRWLQRGTRSFCRLDQQGSRVHVSCAVLWSGDSWVSYGIDDHVRLGDRFCIRGNAHTKRRARICLVDAKQSGRR
jgi:hypothetical protein